MPLGARAGRRWRAGQAWAPRQFGPSRGGLQELLKMTTQWGTPQGDGQLVWRRHLACDGARASAYRQCGPGGELPGEAQSPSGAASPLGRRDACPTLTADAPPCHL